MKKWILIGILVLVIVGFFVFNAMDSVEKGTDANAVITGSQNASTGDIKEFDLMVKKWEFSPERIEVNQGDKIVLNVESVDVAHGMMIPEFGVDEYLQPGEEVRVEFFADKKGTFSFFCNVYCGAGHGNMRGKLIVN